MRTSIIGSPVDILTMAETVNLARGSMRERRRLQHVALNVAKLVNMRTDPVLAADVAGSDLVGIDGMGIIFALRALRKDAKERVAGIDLFLNLMSVCAEEGYRPYFLGATETVIARAVTELRAQWPTLEIAGYRNGHFSSDEEAGVIATIRNSRADCLFIGMPTPKKERLLARYRDTLGTPFIMGVGGSFDVVAGEVARAPKGLQSAGLEWLYRVYQEPGRLWWRYARTNAIFFGLLTKEIVMQRVFGGRHA